MHRTPRERRSFLLDASGAGSVIRAIRCFKITDQTVWKEKLFLGFGFEFINE